MHRKKSCFTLICLLLTACASAPPFDMTGADLLLTPTQAMANIDAARGRRAVWGGTVINTTNRKDTTEIELLGYPLDREGRPDRSATAQQRFLIVRSGYLESADYRTGRLVSAIGTVTGTQAGKVGEASYAYPVLRADELYLWPIEEPRPPGSNVQFGIGVGIIFR